MELVKIVGHILDNKMMEKNVELINVAKYRSLHKMELARIVKILLELQRINYNASKTSAT